ncbi:hypothetical protein ACVXG7_11765 [Enterobacter hormaechei]
MLDWEVNSKLSANVSWTMHGRQKPRENAEIRKRKMRCPTERSARIPSWVWQ